MKNAKRLVLLLLIVAIFASMLPVTASASGTIAWGAANIEGNGVRIRSGPGLTHSILSHANRGDIVVIIDRTNSEWYKVNFHGTVGYISVPLLHNSRTAANFNARGSIGGNAVNMRERPNTTSSILGSFNSGTVMNIIGINNGWYKVEHGTNTGYVRSDLMSIVSLTSATSSTANAVSSDNSASNASTSSSSTYVAPSGPAPDPNLPLGQQIAEFATGFVGARYVWGGTSPSGFDCSGLVTYVMRQFDISVTRTASGQYRDNGVHIDKSELVPGDLVFFSTNGRSVTHVGIYIGDGKFVHASGVRVGVIISELNSASRIRTWFGAKRLT